MQNTAFQHAGKQDWQTVAPGVERKIMGYDKSLMMVQVRFAAGAVGAPHSHIHVQATYVAAGTFEVTIDGATQVLQEGDSFFVAPNLVHGVLCREAGLLIDVFTPCREDFLD